MAQAEYGVNRDFIVKGIRAGKLEYRNGVIWKIRILGLAMFEPVKVRI